MLVAGYAPKGVRLCGAAGVVNVQEGRAERSVCRVVPLVRGRVSVLPVGDGPAPRRARRSTKQRFSVRAKLSVGVDLGTTNSAVARYGSTEAPELMLSIEGGHRTLPSVVQYLPGGTTRVGREAQAQRRADPRNTFHSVKRFIGQLLAGVGDDASDVEYGVSPSANGGAAVLECPALGRQLLPEEVSAEVLKGLWTQHVGATPARCVVTVPPHFKEPQRSATQLAATLAGVPTSVTLYEPVAAALAYGLNLQDFSRILVCDLGGGTFDVSVIETGCESVEVMGVAGDGRLGGNDWDARIARWIVAEVKERGGPDCFFDESLFAHVSALASAAKIALTDKTETPIDLSGLAPEGGTLRLSRAAFEDMTCDLVERLRGPIMDATKAAGVALGDVPPAEGKWVSQWGRYKVDQVIMVGGATRMPAVGAFIREVSHMEPLDPGEVDPDVAVALGAALYAAMLDGVVTQDCDVVDGMYNWGTAAAAGVPEEMF